MQHTPAPVFTAVLVSLAGFLLSPSAQSTPRLRSRPPVRYAITDVGSLDPGNNGTTCALALNDVGAIVGFGQSAPHACGDFVCVDSHAFLARGDTIVDLALAGSAGPSSANDVNDSFQVVGSALPDLLGRPYAVLWDGGAMFTLADLGGSAWAFAIDEAGRIVGAGQDMQSRQRPIAWRDGVPIDLGMLPGGAEGFAGDINASGLVVGGSEDALGVTQPVAWVGGRIRQLGVLDPVVAWGEALAVNDSGQAVGASSYWNDLFGGVQIAIAHASGSAFLWSDGITYDLNDAIDPLLGWTLYSARGIGDEGSIVGIGACPCGGEHGFLLTPLD